MASYYFSSSTGVSTANGNTAASGGGGPTKPWKNFWEEKSGANALSPDDICYFKAGDIWLGGNSYVNVDSNGTSGHPITMTRYGTGADPIFCQGSIQSGWTYTGANNIYKKAGLFSDASVIGVDSDIALFRCYTAVASLQAGTFKYNSDGFMYIRLWDNTDPATHTIYVPGSYQADQARGVVRGSSTRGKFINFVSLKVIHSNGIGFSTSQSDSQFQDCTAIGCGREGFMFNTYVTTSEYADRSRAYRCVASYCAAGSGAYDAYGSGQAYTTYAPYTWWINCTSHHNACAGFDFLHYSVSGIVRSDVRYSGMVYCISHDNGWAPTNASMQDPAIYVDGAHDILVYGCVAYNSGTGFQASRNANNVMVSSEHQDCPVYNVHIVNNLIYNAATGYGLVLQNGGDYPAYNNAPATYGNTVVNNTVIKDSNGYGGCFRTVGLGSTVKTIVKNNLFYRKSGSSPILMWFGASNDSTVLDMDYNCFADPNKSQIASTTDSANKTLAQWQSDRGLDAHSIYTTNPQLIDNSFTAMNARLSLSPASPCIGAGTTSAPWTPPQWVIDAGVLADNGAVVGSTRVDGVSDTGTFDIGYHYYSPTPNGSLTSTNIQPATLYLATTNTVTVSFTTATAWPSTGKVEIALPTTLGGGFSFNSTGASVATFTVGGSGSLAFTNTGAVATLTRSGGSDIAASTAVTLTITNVLNPPQTGATGAYQIRTTDSAGTSIDIDTNVSSDQIIAPPATYKTITIQGINMKGVIFS